MSHSFTCIRQTAHENGIKQCKIELVFVSFNISLQMDDNIWIHHNEGKESSKSTPAIARFQFVKELIKILCVTGSPCIAFLCLQ